MGDDIDRDMKRLMDELDEDMEFMPMGETALPPKRSFGLKSKGKILIFGSVVILAFVLLIMLFPRGGNNIPKGELIALKAKLDHLEKRITDTATIKSQIDHLERREEGLRKRTAETVISVDALSKEIEELAKKIDGTKTKPVPVATKTTIPPASRKQTKPALVVTMPETPPARLEQTKQTPHTQRYHVVRSGENLFRISLRYGITLKKLCRINNITVDHVIRPGDKILVNPGTAD
jgi:LysM repeat protein